MFCIDGGRPFLEKLKLAASKAKSLWWPGATVPPSAVCRPRTPNPTRATPVDKIIHDKPVINVPGCPAIPDVMSAIVAYLLTYDRLPSLDAQGRPAGLLRQARSRPVRAPRPL